VTDKVTFSSAYVHEEFSWHIYEEDKEDKIIKRRTRRKEGAEGKENENKIK
jgi:hypothetical protein